MQEYLALLETVTWAPQRIAAPGAAAARRGRARSARSAASRLQPASVWRRAPRRPRAAAAPAGCPGQLIMVCRAAHPQPWRPLTTGPRCCAAWQITCASAVRHSSTDRSSSGTPGSSAMHRSRAAASPWRAALSCHAASLVLQSQARALVSGACPNTFACARNASCGVKGSSNMRLLHQLEQAIRRRA